MPACEICGRSIPAHDQRRATCGHLRCIRARTRLPRLITMVRAAMREGATPAAATMQVAQATGEPTEVVYAAAMSVRRAA